MNPLDLIPAPYRLAAGAAMSALVLGGAAVGGGWLIHRLDADKLHEAQARASAAEGALTAKAKQDRVTAAVVVDHAEKQAAIQTVTRTLIQKVPVYVTREDDARCHVPAGAVGVLDAAAAGVSTVPEPARGADAAAPPALSGLVAGVMENYGVCRANAQQITSLQDWLRGQAAVKP